MKLPNRYGSVYKLSGKRRRPYIVQKTVKWEIDPDTGKVRQIRETIGYAKTKAEGLKMLAEYNSSPYDIEASRKTFADVYEDWSRQKFPTISNSNAKAYSASYACCEKLKDKAFKDIRVQDMQEVVDTLNLARKNACQGKPQVILAHTEMGMGVDFMMGTHKWHGTPPNDEQAANALSQLTETLGDY